MSYGMVREDDRTSTHLRRMGVNPTVVARLRGYAEYDGIGLSEYVRYILSDYSPSDEIVSEMLTSATGADAPSKILSSAYQQLNGETK